MRENLISARRAATKGPSEGFKAEPQHGVYSGAQEGGGTARWARGAGQAPAEGCLLTAGGTWSGCGPWGKQTRRLDVRV